MGTRSYIVAKHSRDNLFHCIYCHWDGYPDGVGKCLVNHYQDQAKIDALMDLGDISSLDADPFTPPDGHTFDSPADGYVIAYRRDRGENIEDHPPADSLEKAIELCNTGGEEYHYAFIEGVWMYRRAHAQKWIDLRTELKEDENG